MDGAPNSGEFLPTQLIEDPTLSLGEVQCCHIDLSQCTRTNPSNSGNSNCISGNGDDVKYTYLQAEELCGEIDPIGDWDLCPRELIEIENPGICASTGCSIDYELVWVKRESKISGIHTGRAFLD